MNDTIINTIVGGIVAIAGLIFVKKRKTKITKRKHKTIDTTEEITQDTTQNQNQLTKI